jgi:DNA processing protein
VESLTLATVSGGARGVDQKTHQISIWRKKPTVVFLPAGLACPYPENIKDWFQPVIENGGAIVSQFRPFMHMQKSYFSERNRMIAALSPLTLLVECKRRSGTVLTANHALDYGSDLAVMPTSPDMPGLGGMDLVKSGHAKIVLDSEDLVRVYHEALLRQATRT